MGNHVSQRLQFVDFHGEPISTCMDERTGKIYCLPKELCARFGIDWASQYKKLKSNQLFSKGVVLITIPTTGGTQDCLLFDIDLLPAWLLSINAGKVAAEVAAKLSVYQEECARALRDYWFHGKAERQPTVPAVLPSVEDKMAVLERGYAFLERLGMVDQRDRLFMADMFRSLMRQHLDPSPPSPPQLPAPPVVSSVAERLLLIAPHVKRAVYNSVVHDAGRRCVKEYRNRYHADPPTFQQYIHGALRSVKCYEHKDLDWVDALIQIVLVEHGVPHDPL